MYSMYVVDSHIQRFGLATEETVVAQVSHRPIKCQIPLVVRKRYEGLQIATKLLPGPTNREHRKLIDVEDTSVFIHPRQREELSVLQICYK